MRMTSHCATAQSSGSRDRPVGHRHVHRPWFSSADRVSKRLDQRERVGDRPSDLGTRAQAENDEHGREVATRGERIDGRTMGGF